MKYIKKYEKSNTDFEIYFTHTKDGNTTHRTHYSTEFYIEYALKKVTKLINSYLTIDKLAPRFEHWSLDDYWIEIYENNEKIDVVDKEDIDATFDAEKYNL